MSSPLKNYKIIVDSKHFGNMKGISPAEVSKKAAGKILGKSNNRITQFSMIETKNGKIRNYKAFKENLIRPYKKNGKLITCRIIVKKIGKHTGGGEAEKLSKNIYNKETLSEQDIEKIKATMVIRNTETLEEDFYDPYDIGQTIKDLATDEDIGGIRDLELGENDPVRHFFAEYSIEIDYENDGWIKMSCVKYDNRSITIGTYKVNYDFSGSKSKFSLNIYNLSSSKDTIKFKQNCDKYVEFLKKIYPESKISVYYVTNG